MLIEEKRRVYSSYSGGYIHDSHGFSLSWLNPLNWFKHGNNQNTSKTKPVINLKTFSSTTFPSGLTIKTSSTGKTASLFPVKKKPSYSWLSKALNIKPVKLTLPKTTVAKKQSGTSSWLSNFLKTTFKTVTTKLLIPAVQAGIQAEIYKKIYGGTPKVIYKPVIPPNSGPTSTAAPTPTSAAVPPSTIQNTSHRPTRPQPASKAIPRPVAPLPFAPTYAPSPSPLPTPTARQNTAVSRTNTDGMSINPMYLMGGMLLLAIALSRR